MLPQHRDQPIRPPRGDARQEARALARVLERLRSPPLSHGMARELRKHVTIVEREIAELTKAGMT